MRTIFNIRIPLRGTNNNKHSKIFNLIYMAIIEGFLLWITVTTKGDYGILMWLFHIIMIASILYQAYSILNQKLVDCGTSIKELIEESENAGEFFSMLWETLTDKSDEEEEE